MFCLVMVSGLQEEARCSAAGMVSRTLAWLVYVDHWCAGGGHIRLLPLPVGGGAEGLEVVGGGEAVPAQPPGLTPTTLIHNHQYNAVQV